MEAGDDGQRLVGFNDKHQGVGKAAEQGATHILVDHWELARICANGLDYGFNRGAKTPAQARNLIFVPVLRIDQLGAGAWCENNRKNYGQRRSSSDFKAAHVMPSCRSWSRVARRLSSSACCAALSGSWPSSKLSQSCEINARRSDGDRRTSSSRVSNSMH